MSLKSHQKIMNEKFSVFHLVRKTLNSILLKETILMIQIWPLETLDLLISVHRRTHSLSHELYWSKLEYNFSIIFIWNWKYPSSNTIYNEWSLRGFYWLYSILIRWDILRFQFCIISMMKKMSLFNDAENA